MTHWLIAFFVTALGVATAVFRKYYLPKEMASQDRDVMPVITNSTPVQPSIEAVEPSTPKGVPLTLVALAMRDFEGQKVNKQGVPDPNWKNNNPLNCKFYYGGYLPKYEPVKRSAGGFAIFKDYATGWMYGCNELRGKIAHHPNWTLLDLISDHAPSSENDPLHYTKIVATTVGIPIDFPVKNLV